MTQSQKRLKLLSTDGVQPGDAGYGVSEVSVVFVDFLRQPFHSRKRRYRPSGFHWLSPLKPRRQSLHSTRDRVISDAWALVFRLVMPARFCEGDHAMPPRDRGRNFPVSRIKGIKLRRARRFDYHVPFPVSSASPRSECFREFLSSELIAFPIGIASGHGQTNRRPFRGCAQNCAQFLQVCACFG